MSFHSFLHGSSCFSDVDFAACVMYRADYAIFLVWVSRSFGLTSRDLSVVSDLKTVRIPCCCRWRWRGSETPLIYGSTAVDLNSAVSLSGVGFLVLVTFCKKDGG